MAIFRTREEYIVYHGSRNEKDALWKISKYAKMFCRDDESDHMFYFATGYHDDEAENLMKEIKENWWCKKVTLIYFHCSMFFGSPSDREVFVESLKEAGIEKYEEVKFE